MGLLMTSIQFSQNPVPLAVLVADPSMPGHLALCTDNTQL